MHKGVNRSSDLEHILLQGSILGMESQARTYRGSSCLQLHSGGWQGGRAGRCGPGHEGQRGPARLMGPSAEQGAPASAPDTRPCKTGGRGQRQEVPGDVPSPQGTAQSQPSLLGAHPTAGWALLTSLREGQRPSQNWPKPDPKDELVN